MIIIKMLLLCTILYIYRYFHYWTSMKQVSLITYFTAAMKSHSLIGLSFCHFFVLFFRNVGKHTALSFFTSLLIRCVKGPSVLSAAWCSLTTTLRLLTPRSTLRSSGSTTPGILRTTRSLSKTSTSYRCLVCAVCGNMTGLCMFWVTTV